MATRATWELDCDRPGCMTAYQPSARVTRSNALIRRAARADGWHALEAGKTYCPDHKTWGNGR
jgi:hypothetical protein